MRKGQRHSQATRDKIGDSVKKVRESTKPNKQKILEKQKGITDAFSAGNPKKGDQVVFRTYGDLGVAAEPSYVFRESPEPDPETKEEAVRIFEEQKSRSQSTLSSRLRASELEHQNISPEAVNDVRKI